LEDVKAPEDGGAHGQRKQFGRSLPVIYALEVATKEGKLALADWSKRAPNDIEAAHKALAMIDECGAGIYMSMKLEYHRQAGQQALRRANPEQQAAQQLEKLILNL
jgi:geranylgeranyl pyrophosphate synthase